MAAAFTVFASICGTWLSSYNPAMASPEAALAKLDALRAWIDRHRNQAITILAFVVGAWLVVTSIYELAT